MKWPAAQALHSRLLAVVSAVVSYSPAWHTVSALHTRSTVEVGGVDSYWVEVQSVCELHVRSLEVVAAVAWCWPLEHVCTATHAAPLSTVENVVPSTHAAHSRSDVAEPAVLWPELMAHVAHAAHVDKPAVAVKVPLAQAAHVRSMLAVAAVVVL